MKRKLILFAIVLVFSAAGFIGCNTGTKQPLEDSGPYDASKVIVNGISAELTAELGRRFLIPVAEVTYGGVKKESTFKVTDSNAAEVDIISRGTKFFVEDVNGYKIDYYLEHLGEKHIIATSEVKVLDTVGPEIDLPASTYTMTVYKDSVVQIPVAEISDVSNLIKSTGVKVFFKDQPVDIIKGEEGEIGAFVANEYGEYVIEYTAVDGSDNVSVEKVIVNCARMITLCDFDDDSNVWAEGMEFVTDHAYSGNALKVTTQGSADYYMLAVYPEIYNLGGFDKLSVNIWVSRDLTSGNEGFYLLNQVFRLQEGNNILTIDRDSLSSQYPGGIVPSSNPQYSSLNYIYFQLCGDNVTFYIDNLVGIYDNFETDDKVPVIDFGKENASGIINTEENGILKVPAVTGYDNTMENVTIDYTVKTAAGKDITADVKSGAYRAAGGEVYTVTYTATDINGLTSARELTINVRAEEAMEIPSGDDIPVGRRYDMLQDFETGLNSSVAVSPVSLVPLPETANSETYARTDKSMKIGPTAEAYGAVKIRLLKNGKVMTQEDFEAYEYLQVSVVCTTAGTQFYFYNQPFTLTRGLNVLKIAKEVYTAQLNAESYNAEGWLWCQTNPVSAGKEYSLYLDQFIGVYPSESEIPDPVFPSAEYDELNTFETGQDSSIWVQGGVIVTPENAVKGNAVRFTTSADWQAVSVSMKKNGKPLTREDIAAYEYFQVSIYAAEAGATIYFYNKDIVTLQQGANTVTISSADFLSQMDLENSGAYNMETGFAFFQISNGSSAYTLYFDNLLGVYPEA